MKPKAKSSKKSCIREGCNNAVPKRLSDEECWKCIEEVRDHDHAKALLLCLECYDKGDRVKAARPSVVLKCMDCATEEEKAAINAHMENSKVLMQGCSMMKIYRPLEKIVREGGDEDDEIIQRIANKLGTTAKLDNAIEVVKALRLKRTRQAEELKPTYQKSKAAFAPVKELHEKKMRDMHAQKMREAREYLDSITDMGNESD
jgi:NAD-dependent SIR2 family protein deacetylase